jgi:hypothetical protein
MRLVVDQLLLLGLLTTGLHWLIARAEISRFFWSRTTGILDKLLRCPACSGFWLGLGLSPWIHPVGVGWGPSLCTGLLALVLTPLGEALLLKALEVTVIEKEDD